MCIWAWPLAKLAVDDAALPLDKVDPTRFGAVIGSGGGGFDDGPGYEDLNEPILRSWDEEEKTFDSAKFGEQGVPVAHPLFLLKALPNNAFYYISLLYNIQGENNNIISSYTGGSQAIGDAFRAVRRGDADIMIAGGYDSLLTPNTIFSLHTMNLLSAQQDPAAACRPFDRLRDGMVAGEGAGFVLVEELSHAQARGAQIYAEIVGYGNASSAYHIYQPAPDGEGIRRAVKRALEDAQLEARLSAGSMRTALPPRKATGQRPARSNDLWRAHRAGSGQRHKIHDRSPWLCIRCHRIRIYNYGSRPGAAAAHNKL